MKFIYQKKSALTEGECTDVIDFFESNKDKHQSGKIIKNAYGRNKCSTDWTKSFYHEDKVDLIIGPVLAKGMKEYVDLHPGIREVDNLWDVDYEYNLQKYQPGEGFKNWHCENSGRSSYAMTRILAWMIYLNDMPDGEAETEFLYQRRRIKPTAGTVVLWPAGFTHTHKGNTVLTQDKYILTGWYIKAR